MSTAAPALIQPLEAPLPSEVAGRGQSWFTEYRRYPTYSRHWGRARLRPYLLAIGLLLVALAVPTLTETSGPPPLGGFVSVALQMLVPALAGPWLCLQVRRRGLAPAREAAALVAVLVALVAGVLAFQEWGSEPMKQWLAEQTGAVDAQGKRKKVIMAIGVSVTTPEDQERSKARDAMGEGLPTPWANLISTALVSFWLAGGAGLWGLRRERLALESLARERELTRAQAQRREAEMQLSVLAAQVEPHFLFNTLAGVRSAIATDPSRASDMIDRLVDYLRAAIPRLRSDGGAEATLGSQLDIVRAYLALMHARMPRLSHDIQLPADLAAAPCPPLMLISLAENAIKHGAEPKIGPVHIHIEARRAGPGRVEVTVADNGAGFAEHAQSGGGLGLSNIRERLRQMHGAQASLSLRAPLEAGHGSVPGQAPTAILADDEDLPRAELRRMLATAWPELRVLAECEHGPAAVEALDAQQPDIAFLDIRMPGQSGLDVARAASGRCHIVFTTAYDSHAVSAFEAGAVDYLLKPIAADRLAQTVQRLKDRLTAKAEVPALEPLVAQLAARLQGAPAQKLRWVSASVGDTIKLFGVDEVLFFQSDEKYTRVVTATDEAHIRKPLKEIADGLDGDEFWQVHRGLMVRASAIARAQRDELGRITLHLRNHPEKLAVSQAWAWRFKPM